MSGQPATKSRAWIYIVLAIIAVAGAVAGWLYYRGAARRGFKELPGTRVVPELRPAEVAWLTIRIPGKCWIRLVRKRSGWLVESPLNFPADEQRVRNLLETWKNLRSAKVVTVNRAADLSRLGLGKPCLEVVMGFDRRRPITAAAGCVKKEGFTPVRVGRSLRIHLVKKGPPALGAVQPGELRSRRAVLASPALTTRVKLTDGSGKKLVVIRSSDGGWVMKGSFGSLPAFGRAVLRFLNDLDGWRWVAFRASGMKVADLSRKAARWHIELKQGEQVHELKIFGACPGANEAVEVARLRPYPAQFCVPQKTGESLKAPWSRFLDPRAMPLDTEAVTLVEWPRGKAGFRLERSAGRWTVVRGRVRFPADRGVVRALLNGLASVRAQTFEVLSAEKAEGQWKKALCLEFGTGSASKRRRVCVAEGPSGSRVLLRRDREPVALVVKSPVRPFFKKEPSDFRSLTVMAVDRGRLQSLAVRRGSVSERLTHVHGHWRMQAPVAGRVDGPSASALVDVLQRLRAKAFVGRVKGLKRPDAVFQIRLRPVPIPPPRTGGLVDLFWWIASVVSRQAETHSLAVAFGKGDGDCHGRVHGQAFLMDKKTCRVMRRPLAPRRLFEGFPARKVTRMEQCLKGSCVTLAHRGGIWTLKSKVRTRGERFSQSVVRDKLALFMSLRAARVLAYIKPRATPATRDRVCLTSRLPESLRSIEKGPSVHRFCVVKGDPVKVSGRTYITAWVAGRPVLYALLPESVKRLFAPVLPR